MGTGYRNRRRRGMALPLALITVLIISALLSGIMLLGVSHLALSDTNSDHAAALALAEAGINWELQKLSLDPTQAGALADQSPASVQVQEPSGRLDAFAVEVEPDPAGGIWSPPSPFWVIATGTVDRVSRTVRVRVEGLGPGGQYALFGINQLRIGGNATIDGAMGTNGDVTLNGTSATLNGNFWYCGPDAGGEDVAPEVQETGHDAYHAALPEYFPTVNDLANQRARERWGATDDEGVNFFAAHNDNASITDLDGNSVTVGSILETSVALAPGDYYFEDIKLNATDQIRIDNATGVVNIWLGLEGDGADEIVTINGGSLVFTTHDASLFNLNVGSRRTLRMNGTMDFWGMIHVYNGDEESGYYGSMILNGDGFLYGSVIAWDVEKVLGDCTVIYPSEGGPDNDADPAPSLYRSWEELNPL